MNLRSGRIVAQAWERRHLACFNLLALLFLQVPALAAIPEIISDQHTRGHRYLTAKQPDQALTVWQNALRLSDTKLGATSQQSRCLSFDLAICYYELKRYGDSLPLLEKLAATPISGDPPAPHARVLVSLASTQHALSNDSSAIQNYKKALLLLRSADRENPDIASILADAHIGYASILFNSNEQPAAERELRTALTLLDNAPSPSSIETRRKAMETLATLLMLTGRTNEASSLKHKIIHTASPTSPATSSVILPEDRGSSALERLANEFLEEENEAEEKSPTIPPCGCELSTR